MDWSTIGAAIAGAAIGWLGELTGRLGARRDAARHRREALEDARSARLAALEDEERRARAGRTYAAAEAILQAFSGNPVDVMASDGEAVPAALRINAVLYTNSVHMLDRELRRRLVISSDILDLATVADLAPGGFSVAEVVFVLRNNCYPWVGAWLRGESLPDPDGDWLRLREALKVSIASWHQEIKDSGSRVHPRTFDEY